MATKTNGERPTNLLIAQSNFSKYAYIYYTDINNSIWLNINVT